MEGGVCRRVTAPTTKRKRQSTGSVRGNKIRRQRRSKNGDSMETNATPSETGKADLKQESWSSGLGSISDDEDLPPAVLTSPAKNSTGQTQTFKKHDIVWIKYWKEKFYRPCLITSVSKDKVKFKVIYGPRKYTYQTKLKKVIGFDDPDKNNELLNLGRKENPHIIDAYERARLYFCRLSEQNDLSPLKYLFFDKTEDLLYGILPEHEVENKDNVGEEKDENRMDDDEFDCLVSDCSDDDNEEHNENNEEPKGYKDDIYVDIYEKITVEEKAKLSECVKILLKTIASEDCLTYLKQIVKGTIESFRMKYFNDGKDLKLQVESGGLGPFYGADSSETDELLQIVNNHAETLQCQGDLSLLLRHVLAPEAIIYALNKEWNCAKENAEAFFMEWTLRIPDWKLMEPEHVKEPEQQNAKEPEQNAKEPEQNAKEPEQQNAEEPKQQNAEEPEQQNAEEPEQQNAET